MSAEHHIYHREVTCPECGELREPFNPMSSRPVCKQCYWEDAERHIVTGIREEE